MKTYHNKILFTKLYFPDQIISHNVPDGPVEFLNGTGVVCQNNNDYDTHFHATMCDASGQVFGGHIVKGYTPTLTTVDLIIFEIKNIEMLRVYDEETDLTQFLPK